MPFGVPWDPTEYQLTGEDAVMSLLIDNSSDFYITTNEQTVYVFLHGRGLIRILHNFSGMSTDEINEVIHAIISGDT